MTSGLNLAEIFQKPLVAYLEGAREKARSKFVESKDEAERKILDIFLRLTENFELKAGRSTYFKDQDEVIYRINVGVNINSEIFKKYKKELKIKDDGEIGYFNFTLTEASSKELKREVKVTYLSEIQIGESYRKHGLFSSIFSAYDNFLEKNKVDMDYLHVKSNIPRMADIYKDKGYQFTPQTIQTLDKEYGGVDSYLKNSSVSENNKDNIVMYRIFHPEVLNTEIVNRKIGEKN